MKKEYFVEENSVVRQIWGNADTILFIFAGASAEFALNKAVDWLYHTGKLPADPLGRLFSTVAYARKIVFSEKKSVYKTINQINAAHAGVESNRGAKIPDWAYRDVLFMLIDYSIRSFEVLERKLDIGEKQEVFNVFYKVGLGMHIKNLPQNFTEFEIMRRQHLQHDLYFSDYTQDLFKQYRRHLGFLRFWLLLESQKLIVPKPVYKLLNFKKRAFLKPVIALYKISRTIKLDWFLKELILPSAYKKEIKTLDVLPG